MVGECFYYLLFSYGKVLNILPSLVKCMLHNYFDNLVLHHLLVSIVEQFVDLNDFNCGVKDDSSHLSSYTKACIISVCATFRAVNVTIIIPLMFIIRYHDYEFVPDD